MDKLKRTALHITLLALGSGCTALDAHADSCDPQMFRWQEDCRADVLANDKHIDPWRYIALNEEQSAWLTLGGETRLKEESLDNGEFGLGRTRSWQAFGERLQLEADFRTLGGWETFLQFNVSDDHGREPAERPFDRSAIDVAQAFVGYNGNTEIGKFHVRIGRQEIDSQGNRLLSLRDAANIRRAFNAELLQWDASLANMEFVIGRPVLNAPYAFDDRSDHSDFFRAIFMKPHILDNQLSLFFFDRDRTHAVYQDAIGVENRKTLGVRYHAAVEQVDMSFQAACQWGSIAQDNIRAEALAGEIKVPVGTSEYRPRVGLSFGIASGDRHAHDGTLNTFDVVYPNLSYFTDAPVYFPGNTWDVKPNISFNPVQALSVEAGVDLIHRLNANDAIYQPPGVPLVAGNGMGGSSGVTLPYFTATWQARQNSVYVSLVRAMPGSVLKQAGAQTTSYAMAQWTFKF